MTFPPCAESPSIASYRLSDIRTGAYRRTSAGIRMRELPVLEYPHIIVVIPVFGRCRCGVDRP